MGGKKIFISVLGTGIVLIFSFLFIISEFSWKKSSPAKAATVHWIGVTLGDWNVPGNWDSGTVPTSADTVYLNGTTATVPAGTMIDFDQLYLGSTSPATLILIGNIGTGGNITLNSGSNITQKNSVQQVISGDLFIQNGGTLTHAVNTTTQSYVVNFKANNITIDSGGSVNVDGKGYQGGTFSGDQSGSGPGGAQVTNSTPGGTGGGGHGGTGGDADLGNLGGTAYCNASNISTMGSGGGSRGTSGGAGGGLIILEAVSTLTVNGSMSAKGDFGFNATLDGGGAGGGIKLKAATITGFPSMFTVAGGNAGGTYESGGGGGGCASLTFTSSSSISTSTIIVTGGTGFNNGQNGFATSTQLGNDPPPPPPNNIPPVINSIIISTSSVGSPISAFDLNEGVTRSLYVYGQYSDENGCSDVASLQLRLYRSTQSMDCSFTQNSPDPAFCYNPSSMGYSCNFASASSDICNGSGDIIAGYECSVPIYYFADATDAGLFSYEGWVAEVNAIDVSNSSATVQATTEFNTLTALDVGSSISYGTLNLGATSTSDTSLTVVNTGNNNTLNLSISGTDMLCAVGAIPVGNQRFSFSGGTAYSSMTALTGNPMTSIVNIPKVTSTSVSSTFPVYWKITIPTSGLKGDCIGSTTVSGI